MNTTNLKLAYLISSFGKSMWFALLGTITWALTATLIIIPISAKKSFIVYGKQDLRSYIPLVTSVTGPIVDQQAFTILNQDLSTTEIPMMKGISGWEFKDDSVLTVDKLNPKCLKPGGRNKNRKALRIYEPHPHQFTNYIVLSVTVGVVFCLLVCLYPYLHAHQCKQVSVYRAMVIHTLFCAQMIIYAVPQIAFSAEILSNVNYANWMDFNCGFLVVVNICLSTMICLFTIVTICMACRQFQRYNEKQ